MGRDGNYWGHNAIIRTRAFAAHCGLPDLKGRPPLGGHILSHDFVEAALIRRAGWTVYMLPELERQLRGEPALADRPRGARPALVPGQSAAYARHRRARPEAATRQHFATGIMSYLASPFWLFQLIVGIALVLQTTYIRPEYFSRDFALFPIWPRFDPERALALFALTMGILLAPKLFGLLLMLLQPRRPARVAAAAIRLVLSSLIEVVLSALIAPILMVIQSGAVFQILLGRDTGWQPQRRDDGSIPMRDIVRRHRWHTVLGVFAGVSAVLIATSLFLGCRRRSSASSSPSRCRGSAASSGPASPSSGWACCSRRRNRARPPSPRGRTPCKPNSLGSARRSGRDRGDLRRSGPARAA